MITLILKSYFSVLLSIGMGVIFILVLGLYWIYKLSRQTENNHPLTKTSPLKITPKKGIANEKTIDDFSTIAGDDIIATQLDLARAYVETGKITLARKILESVVEQGSHAQQNEAKELLSLI